MPKALLPLPGLKQIKRTPLENTLQREGKGLSLTS